MIKLLVGLASLFFFSKCFSQSDTITNKKLLIAGIYGSYIWDNTSNSRYAGNPMYNEYTLGSRVLVFPFKNLGGGVQFTKVFTTSVFNSLQDFTLYGPLIQFKTATNSKISFYTDIGFLKGNFCLCDAVPVKKENLNYLSVGAGVYYRIWANFNIEIGFITNNILNKMEYKYGYNHYKIGLYYFLQSPEINNSKSKNVRFL